jgi:xylulose-5-phosphate/fructose-6-phosphate phosphoketolase
LDAAFEATDRVWMEALDADDAHLARSGRVMEVLSEHLCEGWLEGYLLTGRHGLFSCYEAFIHIVDSMMTQHAKWLKVSRALPWRAPIASLNYLLTSHVWRQDHNGFSHQDPGFLDLVVTKKADIARVYLPPDANCLLWWPTTASRTYDRINVIVAGKQPRRSGSRWSRRSRTARRDRHLGVGEHRPWTGAGRGAGVRGRRADARGRGRGARAARAGARHPGASGQRRRSDDAAAAVEHPHGLDDVTYDGLFPPDVPTIFAFHGYPQLVHRLTYRRANHANLHVHASARRGRPPRRFDMVVLKRARSLHLAEAGDRARTSARRTSRRTARQQRCATSWPSIASTLQRHGSRTCPRSATGGWPYGTAARAGD